MKQRDASDAGTQTVIDHERDLPEFIGLIYDAATDSSRWPLFLDRLCDIAPGAKSVMMMHDAQTSSIRCPRTARWEDDWTASYTDYYVNVHDIVPPEVTFGSEFYRDWLRPQRLSAGITVSIFKEQRRYMNFSVLSDTVDGALQARNIDFVRMLSPHLRRAGQINRQMADLTFASRALEQAFDHLDRGVILLRPDGRAFYCNRQAKEYLDLEEGLLLHRDGRVGCQNLEIEERLDRAIFLAAETARGQAGSAGGLMAIPRREGLMPWSLMIAPMPATALDLGSPEGAVVLFILDRNRKPVISVESLRTMLGLTATETRTAVALAEGQSPEEIAKEHGTAILTVRTHLRNAMGKAGVSRLPELVAIVLRCGAMG
jgi:DNA-binding CsgD family transcriptional regulator/PAS domain-containing protein